MTPSPFARRTLASAIAVALLTSCQGPLVPSGARPQPARPTAWHGQVAPVVRPDPQLLPVPGAAGRQLVEIESGKQFSGTASFQSLAIPFFEDSGAYRLQAQALGRTLVTTTTLEEDLFVKNGEAITGATDLQGAFSLVNAPASRPFVLSVQLAASHRLSALVPTGVSTTYVDEASSMVAEMARWQIRDTADATDPDRTALADLSATTVAALNLKSKDFVFSEDLAPGDGAVPRVDALKVGAGHTLRNRYVAAFGARITAAGDGVADWLSDTWRALLGFRPLALTRVAGSGSRGFNQGDGAEATKAGLASPIDAAMDAAGGVVITEQDSHLLRFVPAVDMPGGYLGYGGPMQAGRIYTIGGVLNGPSTIGDFNGFYQPIETASGVDENEAPPLAVGFPLFTPYRVVLAPTGGSPHMLFTSKFGHRVFLVPGSDIPSRYGRSFLAGRLYTLAGHGEQKFGAPIETDDPGTEDFNEDRNDYLYGEGLPADLASLNNPTGLAVDTSGNVFVLDAGYTENELQDAIASDETDATYSFPNTNAPPGRSILVYHGTIRIIRASDGLITTLRLTLGGQPFPVTGAEDMQLVEDGSGNRTLYVADTAKHWVFSVAVPADLETDALTEEVTPVLGAIGEPGYVRDGVALPDAYRAFDGVPVADARLNGPTSLTFDSEGRLIVADAGTRRLRLLKDGKVYTLAGGFDTNYLEGDARLGYLPQTTSVRRDSNGDLLLVDRREGLVRRIWTRRGSH